MHSMSCRCCKFDTCCARAYVTISIQRSHECKSGVDMLLCETRLLKRVKTTHMVRKCFEKVCVLMWSFPSTSQNLTFLPRFSLFTIVKINYILIDNSLAHLIFIKYIMIKAFIIRKDIADL